MLSTLQDIHPCYEYDYKDFIYQFNCLKAKNLKPVCSRWPPVLFMKKRDDFDDIA